MAAAATDPTLTTTERAALQKLLDDVNTLLDADEYGRSRTLDDLPIWIAAEGWDYKASRDQRETACMHYVKKAALVDLHNLLENALKTSGIRLWRYLSTLKHYKALVDRRDEIFVIMNLRVYACGTSRVGEKVNRAEKLATETLASHPGLSLMVDFGSRASSAVAFGADTDALPTGVTQEIFDSLHGPGDKVLAVEQERMEKADERHRVHQRALDMMG